ncbi:Nuclear inhibitor of protein phosphatase 1 [Lamellibrachia satsuma]|nr:Nuclear inhibitor of protein phosphatase 1 [Lamellibrachia satsuma]
MIQKLMIDEKKCYFFGRNKQLNDFCIDHASCSRVHAALVWHRHLNRPFIIDLNSTHGTFIGSIRIDGRKPQQVPIDSEIHFGASTRRYTIRERPQPMTQILGAASADNKSGEDLEGSLLGLPETETELDNLTEFNTAHNRRISSMADIADTTPNHIKRKRPSIHVDFNEEEEVINPEDIDPSIGRFRNLVQTQVVPMKKPRLENHSTNSSSMTETITKRLQSFPYAANLYGDMPESQDNTVSFSPAATSTIAIASKLGLRAPNLAPDIDATPVMVPQVSTTISMVTVEKPVNPLEPKKKKYAKEAWPGKKHVHSLLV